MMDQITYPDLFASLRSRPVRLADFQPSSVHWAVENLVPKGQLTLISGQPNSGKSQFAMGLTAALTSGRPFADDERFGVGGEVNEVLWIHTDGGADEELHMRARAYEDSAIAERIHMLSAPLAGLVSLSNTEEARAEFRQAWHATMQSALEAGMSTIVIDHLLGIAGASDINASNELAALLSVLADATCRGITVILLHHTSIHRAGKPVPMGHTVIAASARQQLDIRVLKNGWREVRIASNTAATMYLTLAALDGGCPTALSWDSQPLRESKDAGPAEAETRKKSPRGDTDVLRTKALLEASPEVRRSYSAMASYLSANHPELMKVRNPTEALRALTRKQLLIKDGDIYVAGPNWHAGLA